MLPEPLQLYVRAPSKRRGRPRARPRLFRLLTVSSSSSSRSAAVLNNPSTRDAALAALAPKAGQPDEQVDKAHTQALVALAPMLTLPSILAVRGQAGDTEPIDVSSTIDAQRDWVVSTECPPAMRDGFLVRVLGETGGKGSEQQEQYGGGEWASVWASMQGVARDMAAEVDKGIILEADGGRKPVEVSCKTADDFKQELSKASGGVLDKRASRSRLSHAHRAALMARMHARSRLVERRPRRRCVALFAQPLLSPLLLLR